MWRGFSRGLSWANRRMTRLSDMSAELTSLLRRCKEAPEDDLPRMVLADWLEDHGEGERAELVRLSVRLDAEEIDQGDEATSLARLHELYSRNAERWLGGLARRAGEHCFRRGLLEVWCKANALGSLLADVPPHALPWLETL